MKIQWIYTKCKDCPEGRYNDDRAEKRESHDNLDDCKKCQAGRYSASIGLAVACGCQACKKVLCNLLRGMTMCVPCAAGKYQPDAGESTCLLCDSATVNGTDCETSPPPRPTLQFKGKSRLEIVWNDLFDDSISGTTFTIEWGRDEIFRHSDGQITSENASISIATEISVVEAVTFVRVRANGGQWSLPSSSWVTASKCTTTFILVSRKKWWTGTASRVLKVGIV